MKFWPQPEIELLANNYKICTVFWAIFQFLDVSTKILTFFAKISVIGCFKQNFKILANFWTKVWYFDQNFDFRLKFRFLIKISILD